MNPLLIILLIFVGVPLLELYFLIEMGSVIGAIPTIFLTVFTAVLGGLLVRAQGVSTALRVQASISKGELPAVEMLEGAVLLVAGFVLLLPGFFSDTIGFLFLVPFFRRWLVLYFLKRSRVMTPAREGVAPNNDSEPRVIEGEFRREDDPKNE